MTKTMYRIKKNTKEKGFVMCFSERKNAEKIAKRLDFKTFIEEVLLDDEGKVIKRHKI